MGLSRGIVMNVDQCGHRSLCFRGWCWGDVPFEPPALPQQPWKEPGVKASHVLSEPISSVKLAAIRQRAAVMLRTYPAESRAKAETISILTASLMIIGS